MSEAEFTRQVLDLAHLLGWRTLHVRPARTAKGWRTPVAGDGAGFPDLLLIRKGCLLVVELKTGNNRLSPCQSAWLEAFRGAGIRALVWYPKDWPEIERLLT